MFDRESKRERTIEKTLREKRFKNTYSKVSFNNFKCNPNLPCCAQGTRRNRRRFVKQQRVYGRMRSGV